MSVLSEILADKRSEVDCARRRVTTGELERRIAMGERPRAFEQALRSVDRPALIAEVKKASPSKGIIREDFDPVEIGRIYGEHGAACLSVLTDERHFLGKLSYLTEVRAAVSQPVLRKDFIIDEYQVLEARAAGADALLLIACVLKPSELLRLLAATAALGMAAIVEVHDRVELDEVLQTPARIIGINNRDLHQFRTTLQTTIDLVPHVPEGRLIVSESGINRRADVERLRDAGVHAVLVGEALMRERDVAAKMHELLGR